MKYFFLLLRGLDNDRFFLILLFVDNRFIINLFFVNNVEISKIKRILFINCNLFMLSY